MAATTLAGRSANDGLLGPGVALGDRLDAVNDYLTGLATTLGALNTAMRTRALGNPTLAEGTNSATIKVTAFPYSIDGVIYTKATTDNIAVTAAAQQAVTTACHYLVQIIADGTISTVKGTAVAAAAVATAVVPPPTSAAHCPLGYFTVVLANAATFTAGTTDMSASDVTTTFTNLGQLPATTTGSVALTLATQAALQPAAI